MGQVGEKPGQHIEESLSPLQKQGVVINVPSVKVKRIHSAAIIITSLMRLKKPLDKGVKIEEEELQTKKKNS